MWINQYERNAGRHTSQDEHLEDKHTNMTVKWMRDRLAGIIHCWLSSTRERCTGEGIKLVSKLLGSSVDHMFTVRSVWEYSIDRHTLDRPTISFLLHPRARFGSAELVVWRTCLSLNGIAAKSTSFLILVNENLTRSLCLPRPLTPIHYEKSCFSHLFSLILHFELCDY